ncbi:MAG: efflux RND transporter permease subunit [Bacteroidia bacterium]|nr:MAG: efflux RND transporter permease subunit [Bacteroidia bacterium]
MKRIARFAVDNPVTILMIVLGIILLGVISYRKLGTDLFPDLNNPRIYVELKAGERPPEEMEKQFVDQIESISMRQKDAINVSSVSMVGAAQIIVEYSWNKDMDEAFLDLQKDISSFSQNADLDEFNITQYDPNASPVMIIGLTHDRITDMDELRQAAENYIRNELIRLEGIADVQLSGQEESEVVIETNQYLLDAYGVTVGNISQQIANYNRNVSGGSITELGLKYVVKGVSVIREVEDLKNVIITFKQESEPENVAGGTGQSSINKRTPVHLSDIANIYMANKDPENIVTINGERCIGLSIYKEPSYNTVRAVEDLTATLDELAAALPGYHFIRVQDQGKYIDSAIGEVMNTALFGIILAVFVLFIFLRRIGTTIVVSIAIPVSIIATFNLMYFNHLTLNIMTLGGLALGAGMLVDNAIVVLENILRNHEAGMSFKEAAIEGTAEVGGAITASTITTIVVFLPIVYLHGASGEMFKDQAWTVAFSLISSLFVAILVIPLLVSRFFKERQKKEKEPTTIRIGWYPSLLRTFLNHKTLIIILSVILMGATWLILPMVGSEFMPRAESNEFTIDIKLPAGTRLERTAETTNQVEQIVKSLLGDRIKMLYSHVGAATTTGGSQTDLFRGENSSSTRVFLKDEFIGSSNRAIELIEKNIKDIPDTEVSFTKDESALQATLGTDEAPFVVEISGEDRDIIESITAMAKEKLLRNENLFNITTSLDDGTPEVDVVIDRFRASYYSIPVETIVSQIQSYLTGVGAGEFEQGGEIKDITVKLEEVPLNRLNNLLISSGSVSVPLSELASIEVTKSPGEITRNNQKRTAYIYGIVNSEIPFDRIVYESETLLSEIDLPTDYKIEVTGEELKRKESLSNLTFALILSVILVYMVLASQFESLIHPFVILLTIPLAVVGSVWIFFLMGRSLNMMAYIGIIMLAGIAVNDSIILIDRINQLRIEGMKRADAIITAGGQRIRPIIMTSLTTILALLPLTFGFGESASLRSPMALAVVGGLVTSTLLTLIVIPCVYWALDSVKERLGRKKTFVD